ncbi:WD40-repeat-containing domain protein [Scheffersomyces amazonensis]|uniref:WD40-repeat-containing domain protein n=1 Tax=Scheffersomyces amazonensis TaxID=1078765 RepID=UPI00315C6C55
MPTYRDLIDLDADDEETLIPPVDPLSEAMYNNTKMDYTFQNLKHTDEDEIIIDDDDEEDQNVQDNGTEQYDDNIPTTGDLQQQDHHSNTSDTSNWKLLRVLVGAHQGWVRSVEVDPITNKWFATGSSDATIKIWDLASSKIKATLTGHIMGVRALAISSRYPLLFSGSEDKTVRCWDLERTNSPSGAQIRDYHGHVGGIYSMALHPELDLLFTGGRDAVVRVWDVRSRADIMVLTGHRSDISSVQSQIGDPQVITSSMDGTIRLWDLRKQSTALTITQHSKSIRSMIVHPHEMTMCSGDTTGNLKQWLLPEGHLLNEFGKSESGKIINTLSINPASNILFAGYDDGKVEFYDYQQGTLTQSTSTTPVTGYTESTIYSSTFDMSGLRLITCEGDKSIKIWGESSI